MDPIQQDFRNFLFVVWKHLNLPQPTATQYDIALYIATGDRRRIVEAFRGVGKSWITAAYVLWRLYCNPEERILVVSASKDRADSFSIFAKRLLNEIPLLMHLRPKDGQRDANHAFDVGPAAAHQAPSVRSVGITGQLTGGRATIIIADDIEVPKNSMTQAQRDKLSEAVKEFDAVLAPGGEIIYLGTPQCEMSLYNQLPERGYDIRVWPARYPTEAQLERYGNRLAPTLVSALVSNKALVGTSTEPGRFHERDLIERELSYGRSGFALQFMLDATLSDVDRYPLKLSDLIILDCNRKLGPVSVVWASGSQQRINDVSAVGLHGDYLHSPMYVSPDFIPFQGVVMSIDPSGRGGDELAYSIVAMLNGVLYLLDCGGLVGGYTPDNLTLLALRAKEYEVKEVIVESNFGDGMFNQLLQPYLVRHYPVTLSEVHHSTQKEKRIIDTLEPIMNQHRLVVDKGLLKRDQENTNQYAQEHSHKYQLFYQMTRITKERGSLAKDDRLDSLSMAVQYWVEQMGKDVSQNMEEHRARALDEELAKFMRSALGTTLNQSSNWNPLHSH